LIPGTLASGTDALGHPRKNGTVDLGAYEFKPVTAGPTPPVNTTEDHIVAVPVTIPPIPQTTLPFIRIPLLASGGFGSYTFEMVTAPLNYSTDTINACGGQPVFFNQAFTEAWYCPPRQFYNQGIGDPLAVTSFQYRVRDGAGNFSAPDTVNI